MLDASVCAHALHIPGADYRAVAHAVLMLQLAFQDIADNLYIPMTMSTKALAWLNAILIDNTQFPHPICCGSYNNQQKKSCDSSAAIHDRHGHDLDSCGW